MTDEVDQLFANLRGSQFSVTADPNAIAYETQPPGIVPAGFVDTLDPTIRPLSINNVYNGTFGSPPTNPSANIDDQTNPLPGGWSFVQSSGTKVTGSYVTDDTIDSDGILKLSLASGAAGDEGYFELLMPVSPAVGQYICYNPIATINVPAGILGTAHNAVPYFSAQFVKADKTTTTGALGVSDPSWTLALVSSPLPFWVLPNTNGTVPFDAAYLRLRLGLKRGAATTGQSGAVYFHDVWASPSPPRVLLPDQELFSGPINVLNSFGVLTATGDTWTLQADLLSDPATINLIRLSDSYTLPVATNMRGVRANSASLSAGSSADVTITWSPAYPDTNYTVAISAGYSDSTSRPAPSAYVRQETKAAGSVKVRVTNNTSATSEVVYVEAIAIHD